MVVGAAGKKLACVWGGGGGPREGASWTGSLQRQDDSAGKGQSNTETHNPGDFRYALPILVTTPEGEFPARWQLRHSPAKGHWESNYSLALIYPAWKTEIVTPTSHDFGIDSLDNLC